MKHSPDKKESPILTPPEVQRAVEKEREWLKENNAVSAVTGGPVEDMEGIPLPADVGWPEPHSDQKRKARPNSN